MIRVKRIYDVASEDDGIRILVDRVWPRGVSKEKARLDEWRRDLAPSDALRTWFRHDSAKWAEFRGRYREELIREGKWADLQAVAERAKRQNVTLLFGAKDETHNQAVALLEMIRKTRTGRHRAP